MKSSLTEKWIVCRICLRQPKEPMHTIFDQNDDKDLTRMILECGGVPIKQFDHYPDKICDKCLKYLRVAYKFRVICQRSHKHLSRFIAPVVVEKQPIAIVETPEDESIELSLELDEAEEIAVKLEPEELGIKQEFLEHEADVVDVYEPMKDDPTLEDFADLDEIPEEPAESPTHDVEYLDEFDPDIDTSDEEYVPNARSPTKRNMRNRVVRQTTSSSATAMQRQRGTVGRRGGMVGRPPKSPKGDVGKKEPKPKKVKQTSFICDVCGNIYLSQGRLTEHIKLHKGIKPHECEICGHAFAQVQQLSRHMNTHTGNRPFKCSYCPAAFADLSTRNKHHRIHTNERPYVCDVCGKSFTYTNTLKFHKMIHTGEKPFVCDICGKGFQQAYKLRNHKMTHEKKGIKLEKLDVEVSVAYQEVNVATAQILEI